MNQQINTIREAWESLLTNLEHAISGGIWRVQQGSQTWETIEDAKKAVTALAELEAAIPLAQTRPPFPATLADVEAAFEASGPVLGAKIAEALAYTSAPTWVTKSARLYLAAPPAQQAQPTICEGCTQPGYCRQNGCLQPKQDHPEPMRYSPDGEGGMEIDSLGGWVKWQRGRAQAPTESVLVDGIAYDTPAPVAAELLRLHLEGKQAQAEAVPIDMVLYCPKCGKQHIDAREPAEWEAWEPEGLTQVSDGWENPPHKSHLCHGCGHIWRPSDTPTNGVKATASGKHADTAPQQVEAVPQGYVLVPVEPTPEMVKAAQGTLRMAKSIYPIWRDGLLRNYRDMLAAAPQQKGGGHV